MSILAATGTVSDVRRWLGHARRTRDPELRKRDLEEALRHVRRAREELVGVQREIEAELSEIAEVRQ